MVDQWSVVSLTLSQAGSRQASQCGPFAEEVRNLINPKVDKLVLLIRNLCPLLGVDEYDGDRAYARVYVNLEDEPLVRSAIEAIAKKRGKWAEVTEVPGSRCEFFNSPRD